MKKPKKSNDGKASEGHVQEALVETQSKKKLFFMRLYDTTSAKGSYIPAQIADFFFVFKGLSFSLEVKSSSIHRSLRDVPRSYIRDTQIAKLRLLLRAGGHGLFIFEGLKKGELGWEIWDGAEVVSWHRKEQKKLNIPMAAFPKASQMAEEISKVLDFYSRSLQVTEKETE